ncbi:MAG TPA: hypothetical protein VKB89_30995 [Xanthobacteraceae bacterium]|nr:hypothetical protein [Xanthobacteraceae bacterium]
MATSSKVSAIPPLFKADTAAFEPEVSKSSMKRSYAKRSLGSFECLCVCDALSFIEQSCRASACLDLGDWAGLLCERCSQKINHIRFSAKIHPGYIWP